VKSVDVVSLDGSPHSTKYFTLWNPPLTAPKAKPPKAGSKRINMSRTQARAKGRYVSKCRRRLHPGGDIIISRRLQQEAARCALREATQERSRGTHLGGDAMEGAEEEAWMAAVRLGNRRRAALEGADQDGRKSPPRYLPAGESPFGTGNEETPSTFQAPRFGRHGLVSNPEDLPAWRAACQGNAAAAVEGAAFSRQGAEQHKVKEIQHEHGYSSRRLIQKVGSNFTKAAATGSKQQPAQVSKQPVQPIVQSSPPALDPSRPLCSGTASAGVDDGVADDEPPDDAPMDDGGTEAIQQRLPGGGNWKARFGAAGTREDERRNSPIVELSLLLTECIQHGLKTLAFCKTRKLCELVTAYTRETLKATAPHLAHSISVYRAGYSPTERREIERALFNGELSAVAATNALELGVDVGSLDVTLHLGFPGSVASLWQQAGRAGRREQPSLSIYIAFDGPLDQYFMRYPDKLFGRPIENAMVDSRNATLLEQHLTCAAAEAPVIFQEDRRWFGDSVQDICIGLMNAGLLARHPQATMAHGLHYCGHHDNPAKLISLRAIDPERYAILNEENNEVIEEIEESNAFYEVYDGAVYMFQGRTYLCKKLDLDSKVATVRPADLKYYTKVRDMTDIHVVGGRLAFPARVGHEQYAQTTAACAEALVTVRWLGFHRIWQGSGEAFDHVDLFLPDVQFPTQAAYIRVPRIARRKVHEAGLPFRDGLHAASHAMLNVIPLFMLCGSTDMGAECDNPYDTRYRPERLLVYDKHPGGIGLAAQACPLFGPLMQRALEVIKDCKCISDSGCPACIQHTDCGEYNAVLSKQAGIIVLECVLAAEEEHRGRLSLQAGGEQELTLEAGIDLVRQMGGNTDEAMNNAAALLGR
ncbi:hypothetical protein WJX84_006352, partial [Apatococcus fuscideae]